MSSPAIPDVVTVVGSAYFQPIADLLEKLLERPISSEGPAGSGLHENGYSASLVVLLVALLESYTSRLRYVRNSEDFDTNRSTPELLALYFPELPSKDDLIEVFLVRNVILHNHIWHLDVSDFNDAGAPTIATPMDLGFRTNKHYQEVVDVAARRTCRLSLNISPTSVNRSDVFRVFQVIWLTLKYMNTQNFSHTPLPPSSVKFRGQRHVFPEVFEYLEGGSSNAAH